MFTAPQPPRDLVMPAGLQNGLLVALGIGALIVVSALVWTAFRRRDGMPIFVLLGTLLCVVYEPIGDMLIMAYYPETGQITLVTLFGRSIPVFIGVMYICYIGSFVLLWSYMHRRGFTPWSWWSLWGGTAAAIVLLELVLLQMGPAWTYYGPQQMMLFNIPVWITIPYATFLFFIAVGVHKIRDSLPPRHHWLIVLAIPALLAGTHMATSLPAAAASYSTANSTLILLGAVSSVVVSFALTYTLSLFNLRKHLVARLEAHASASSSDSLSAPPRVAMTRR